MTKKVQNDRKKKKTTKQWTRRGRIQVKRILKPEGGRGVVRHFHTTTLWLGLCELVTEHCSGYTAWLSMLELWGLIDALCHDQAPKLIQAIWLAYWTMSLLNEDSTFSQSDLFRVFKCDTIIQLVMKSLWILTFSRKEVKSNNIASDRAIIWSFLQCSCPLYIKGRTCNSRKDKIIRCIDNNGPTFSQLL